MLHFISISLLPILLILAAASDVLSFRIPNWLTIIIALLFFPMALATGMPWAAMGLHIIAGAALFLAGFVLFQFGLFGGGDAKLMAAVGLWFGTAQTLPFLFLTAMAGGALALVVGLWSMFLMNLDIYAGDNQIGALHNKLGGIKPNVPYGFAFAMGGILAFHDTWWITGLA